MVQNRFYAESGYDVAIRAFCRENKIEYQSFWTLTANPSVLSSRLVKKIAANHNKTPEQVLFRFLLQWQGSFVFDLLASRDCLNNFRFNIVTPLTGTTNEEHMKLDLEVHSSFELTNDEQSEMKKLFEK